MPEKLTADNAIEFWKRDNPSAMSLPHGRTVAFDPNEWSKEQSFGTDVITSYYMFHDPMKVSIGLMIATAKEKQPETIDPLRDCAAMYVKPGPVKGIVRRLVGAPRPSEEQIRELCYAACAVHLNSLGVWPPEEWEKRKRDRAEIRERIQVLMPRLELWRGKDEEAAGVYDNCRKLQGLLDSGGFIFNPAGVIPLLEKAVEKFGKPPGSSTTGASA